jgi:hypothetical protein
MYTISDYAVFLSISLKSTVQEGWVDSNYSLTSIVGSPLLGALW